MESAVEVRDARYRSVSYRFANNEVIKVASPFERRWQTLGKGFQREYAQGTLGSGYSGYHVPVLLPQLSLKAVRSGGTAAR